jgi:5,10-methylene-tetrahydrofolate dehydrogenase/methenyl tetrahydrofolate cyclohydrolase
MGHHSLQRIVQRLQWNEDVDDLAHELRGTNAFTLRKIMHPCHAQGFSFLTGARSRHKNFQIDPKEIVPGPLLAGP